MTGDLLVMYQYWKQAMIVQMSSNHHLQAVGHWVPPKDRLHLFLLIRPLQEPSDYRCFRHAGELSDVKMSYQQHQRSPSQLDLKV